MNSVAFSKDDELKDFRVFSVVKDFPESGMFGAPYVLHAGEVLTKVKGKYVCERTGPFKTKYEYSVPADVIESVYNDKYFKEIEVNFCKTLKLNINQN